MYQLMQALCDPANKIKYRPIRSPRHRTTFAWIQNYYIIIHQLGEMPLCQWNGLAIVRTRPPVHCRSSRSLVRATGIQGIGQNVHREWPLISGVESEIKA